MPAPRREDYDTVIRDLESRIRVLERSLRLGGLFLPDSPAPPNPAGGGVVYVQGGSLHYIGPATNTTVAPA